MLDTHNTKSTKYSNWQSLNLKTLLRKPLLAGYLVVIVFFGVIGIWASTAGMVSAVIATGIVSPEGSKKTIQHLEGGIIAHIMVKADEHVEQGEVLVELQGTQARASYQVLQGRKWLLTAFMARLESVQASRAEIIFPDWLLVEAKSENELHDIIRAQINLFSSHNELDEGRRSIGEKRVNQLNEEIKGLQSKVRSQRRQLSLLTDELKLKKLMLDKGLFPKPEYLALQRLEAQTQGDMAQNIAVIARARQSIGETQLLILNVHSERLDRTATELVDVRSELDSVNQKLSAQLDTLTRTLIMAPVSGTVVNIRFHTNGGVVRPGEAILDIVPSNIELLIDTRVQLVDIDEVTVGQETRVVFSAFSTRNIPQIIGRVRSVSADSLYDDISGLSYYLARVEIPQQELAKLGEGVEITPGMPAEVYIVTGERTFLEYILKPLTDSLRRSFQES
jgi:HlyD family secretion protein